MADPIVPDGSSISILDTTAKPSPADTGDKNTPPPAPQGQDYWFALIRDVLTTPFLNLTKLHVRAITDPNRKSPEVALADFFEAHRYMHKSVVIGDALAHLFYLGIVCIAVIRAVGIDLFIEKLLGH